MFFIIGLGLSDSEDITVKGLNAVQSSERIYLEAYTSILGVNKAELEKFYNKTIIIADREMVESNSDEIMRDADKVNVSFLVVGDPFGATTHSDLILRAIEKNLPYKVIHNASIMNAIGCCGLQLYNFGEAVSICFWTDEWKPRSFYEKVCVNRSHGFHTLCLLDIKVKEKTIENIIKNRDIYEPPRYMSVAQACSQLYEIITTPESVQEEETNVQATKKVDSNVFESTLGVGMARIGTESQEIVVDTLKELQNADLGSPLHSLIVVGRLHPMEADFLKLFYRRSDVVQFQDLVDEHNKFYLSN